MINLQIVRILLAAPLLFSLTACGGGGGGQPQQQRTATVSFRTISSAHTAPLEAIQMTVKLPQGATIADIQRQLTGTNGTLGQKSYSPADQTVSFTVTNIGAGLRFGEFALLNCDVATGVTLSQESFQNINNPFPLLEMIGIANGNTVDLRPEIPVTLAVSFGP